MNFNKLIFISILLLVIPFANAQCSYTTGTMLCNNLGEPNPYQIIRPENVKGTIEYFSYTIPSTMRLSVMMAPGTQGLQGPDYDLYTSWTANTCPYNATYKSTDCGYTFPGAGINESCSRWLNPLPAGTYWVAVHHHNGGCTGPNCGYTLQLDCEAATSTTSTSTTSTSTTTIPCNTCSPPSCTLTCNSGQIYRSEIPIGNNEYFSFTLPATRSITIKTAPKFPYTDYNIYTRWLATTCPSLSVYDCSPKLPPGNNESCTYTLTTGTYYVMVNHYGGTGGYYVELNCSITSTTSTTTTRPTTTTIKPQPTTTTIRGGGGGGGGRMPLMIGVTEVLNNPIVILVALIAIVVIIYGAFKFFAMPKKHR